MNMPVTLSLPPEVEARAQREAAKRSLPVETYLEDLVSSAVPSPERDRERSLALLRSVRDLGDEAEQKETFAFLKKAVNEDRLSSRDRFS
jgi:hypothetical protein